MGAVESGAQAADRTVRGVLVVHAVRPLDCPRAVCECPAWLRAVIRGYGHEPEGPLTHPAELLDLRKWQLP